MRAASGRNKKNNPAYASSGFGYDAAGNRESATDQRGLVTAYVHNGFGEVIQQSSPDTGVTVYEYDSVGNRTRRTDARGVLTEWSYDALENSGDSGEFRGQYT